MLPLVGVESMRRADAAAAILFPRQVLIRRAGFAVGRTVLAELGGGYGRRVVVVAGPGSNGADGRVAAEWLRRRGVRVQVLPPAGRQSKPDLLPACDLVVDAAYGTGFRGSYEAPAVPPGVPVVAVDIPSGLNGDTGEAGSTAVRADVTVTFAALKPGLYLGRGPELAGRVQLVDIGLDPGRPAPGRECNLVEDSDVERHVSPKGRDSHKWSAAVMVVAGSPGMMGAAQLAAASAARAGAGMVRLCIPVASPERLPPGDAVTEAVGPDGWAGEVLDRLDRFHALVVGPGLGRTDVVSRQVAELVANAWCPVVVDADALWALRSCEGVASVVARREVPVVLTPHAGEYQRLCGSPPGPDAVAASRLLASRSGAISLLKGSSTVVARPGGDVMVVAAGSARLATAGTGDVLAGVIGAFVARGVEPALAAALAAHAHGRAADLGPAEGLVASDLPVLVSAWLSSRRCQTAPVPDVGHGRGAYAWRRSWLPRN